MFSILFMFNHQQQRQRKEKQIKSVMDFSFAFRQSEGFHQSYQRLFLFWTVHGPFSLFLRGEKEKMGGGNGTSCPQAAAHRPAELFNRV